MIYCIQYNVVIRMEEYIKNLDSNLMYISHEFINDTYYVYCKTKTNRLKHPTKDITTESVKHRYSRNIQDIPFSGKKVIIVLEVKVFKFNKIKGEKNEYVEPLNFMSDKFKRSRRTKRLEQFILDVSNNGSAIATEKTLKRNGIKISDTSINRLIKKNE